MVSVQNPDGSLIVEHADGTRITSLYKDKPLQTLKHTLRHTGEQHTLNTHCSKDTSDLHMLRCSHRLQHTTHKLINKHSLDLHVKFCFFLFASDWSPCVC